MRTALLLVSLAVCVALVSSINIVHKRHRDHSNSAVIPPFVAAGPNDCRSPCPALNTLANHGLLPHDGKNIDHDMLVKALIDHLGLSKTFGSVFAKAATKQFANPATGKFSLCDLLINIHNNEQASHATGIEHAASLSREDRPDFTRASDITQRSPSQAQINILLSSSKDGKMITFNDYVNARKTIWAKTYAAKPALKTDSLDKKTHIVADTEGCLLLGVLSGNSNGGQLQISKDYAQSILATERFPAGWTKSASPFGIPQVLGCLAKQGLKWAESEVTGIFELAKHWFHLGF